MPPSAPAAGPSNARAGTGLDGGEVAADRGLRPGNRCASDSVPAKFVQLPKLLDHKMGRSVEWLYAISGWRSRVCRKCGCREREPTSPRIRESFQGDGAYRCLRDDLLEIRWPASLGIGICKAKRPRAVRSRSAMVRSSASSCRGSVSISSAPPRWMMTSSAAARTEHQRRLECRLAAIGLRPRQAGHGDTTEPSSTNPGR